MSSWDILSATDRRRVARWQHIILAALVLGQLCLASDIYGFAAAIPFVSDSLNLTASRAGFTQGALSISFGIGMIFWSPLSSCISGRRLYLWSMVAIGIGMLAQASAWGLIPLVAARLAIGFAEASASLGMMKLIVGWFPPSRRGVATGMVLAAFSLAIALDFAVGIPVSQAWGWRSFFGGIGALTLIAGLASFIVMKSGPRDLGVATFVRDDEPVVRAAETLPVTLLFRSRWLYVAGVGIFGDTFALAATATWAVPAFVQAQHMPLERGALVGATMGLSQIVFLLIGGYCSDRVPRAVIVQAGAALGVASAALFAAATIWVFPFWILLAVAAFGGAAVFSGSAVFSLLSDKFPDSLVPAAVGYAQIFSLVSNFAAPAFMGVTIDLTRSFVVAFLAFAAAELVVLGVVVALCRERSPRAAAVSVPAKAAG